MGRLLLFAALAILSAFGAGGCEDSGTELPAANVLPQSSGRRRGPPSPVQRATGGTPGRARVIQAPSDNIVLPGYRGRGGGGGGGGGRSVRRPYGLSRGPQQEPADFHAAALEVGNRPIPRGSEACELAFDAMRDLQAARRATTPGRRRGNLDRDNFVSSCELMPEIEQWCMVPSYIREHIEECDRQAHTRYQRAVARAERQDDGEAVDWAPAGGSDEPDAESDPQPSAPPSPSPSMGPVRVEQ